MKKLIFATLFAVACSRSPGTMTPTDASAGDAGDTRTLMDRAEVDANDLDRALFDEGTPDATVSIDLPGDDTAPRVDVPVAEVSPGDAVTNECTAGSDCNDGVDCTLDRCTMGRCEHEPQAARCDDGVACTEDLCIGGSCTHTAVPARCMAGATCDLRMGCMTSRVCGTNADCADMDPCTVSERCDAASRLCRYDTLDGDGDGEPPRVCGGTDCDDGNRNINAAAVERCDLIDNNCNGMVDEGPDMEVCPDYRGTTCRSGRCLCAVSGQVACPSPMGFVCVDTASDPMNCNGCGQLCTDGMCVAGQCRCPAGRTSCGSLSRACVDLETSATNCGGCGRACRADQVCRGAECVCPPGSVMCGGRCVDTGTDVMNCGTCGFRCAAGTVCRDGHCGCSDGLLLCGDRCVDPQRDATNCGICGGVCIMGSVCQGGACICPSGQIPCGIYCVDPQRDNQNCGGCGQACLTTRRSDAGLLEAPPGSDRCMSGRCGCLSGETYCRGSTGTEYCADTQTSAYDCGACGHECGPRRLGPYGQGTWRCVAGTCQCSGGGVTLCGSDCVNLSWDHDHCGACGNACTASQNCISGACR